MGMSRLSFMFLAKRIAIAVNPKGFPVYISLSSNRAGYALIFCGYADHPRCEGYLRTDVGVL